MREDIDRFGEEELRSEEEYRAFLRALRRKQGFGLFFVQASPAKAQDVLEDLQRDLAGKRVAQVMLTRSDERLFEQLEARWEAGRVDIFWIEGLEQSLLGYEDMQRLAGWSEQDLMTYSWKNVPPILSHLNLGRERFEARFDCALVFVVPLFVVKYLLRRAGDFFDWKSGFFEFPDDRQALAEQMINDGNYNEYLKLGGPERLEKILQIRDLLDASEIEIDRRARLLQQMGRLFEAGKNYEQAEISYDHAVQLKPDFTRSWVDRGDALRKMGRYEKAIENYEKAISLNPHDANVHIFLGITYDNNKQYSKAIESFEKSILLDPTDAYVYSRLGSIYRDQKEYSRAIEFCEKAVEVDPNYDYAYFVLGSIYDYQENSISKAVEYYEKAIAVNPDYIYAYSSLGSIYKNQEDYRKAIDCYVKAIELNPQDANAYFNLGNTYKAQKDYSKAIDCYVKAIELNPTAWAFGQRGESYRLTQQYEEAFKDFDRAIELDNDYAWALGQRGEIYRLMECYEEALKDFDRAIELDNDYAWAIASRGQTYRSLKWYEYALKDFDRAIELDNAYDWAINQRGQIHQLLGQFELSLQDFDRVIELDPKDDWYPYLRALTLTKLDRPTEAQADFQTAITLAQANQAKDPIDWRNNFNLALYYLAAGQVGESRELYDRASEASTDAIEEAIRDLDDYLVLFPDYLQSKEIRDTLSPLGSKQQASKAERSSALV